MTNRYNAALGLALSALILAGCSDDPEPTAEDTVLGTGTSSPMADDYVRPSADSGYSSNPTFPSSSSTTNSSASKSTPGLYDIPSDDTINPSDLNLGDAPISPLESSSGSSIPGKGSTIKPLKTDGVSASKGGMLEARDAGMMSSMQSGAFGATGTPMESVFFGFDEFDISPQERTKVELIGQELIKNPSSRLLVRGHTSWHGAEEYNLGLGDRRANAVKNYLVAMGVPADRIEASSMGELEAAQNVDREDPQSVRDRRADLFMSR